MKSKEAPKIRKGRTILVVDDDRQIQDLLRVFLTEQGYHVVSAYRSNEVNQVMNKFSPDLILMDIKLPGNDGLDTFASLKRLNGNKPLPIPVVIISALKDPETVRRASALKVNGYLVKPFNLPEMAKRIRQLLEGV